MKERLMQFLDVKHLSKAQFADSINVARAAISHIFAGRNNPSYDFIVNTITKYPDLNIEWLLTGQGNMFKDNIVSYVALSDTLNKVHSPADNSPSLFEEISTVYPQPNSEKRPVHRAAIKKIVVFFDDSTYEEIC